ncbi:2-C-methyl-D-erythritol 2,4-cyclodiphosphate synthase [Clostridiisalibacter paucivorans]|uniref:2-C-methyl-D-erythritol 2,4-cyclodiphosphate synthase n=1 Tax=Clostridiisalibacter paucivorans TaxID=408753 RepID=UPI00047C0D20|nr:2-C-methyl-D-erythritol 2,4-cyclodiphosphate synthase [Clostridiisalibacter paucivorans]
MRVGIGYDVHKLVENRPLIIGGVSIEYGLGLLGHSDADVLVHAIMDSILGAMGEGDIGKHFPDTDCRYKDISSMKLLTEVYDLMNSKGYKISNIDSVIVAQMPKMAPYIEDMRLNISKALKCDKACINIKATTTERLGFEGRGQGISSQAVCLLEYS